MGTYRAEMSSGHTEHGRGREYGHAHAHGLQPGSDARWLAAAGALIVAFMCAEVTAGVIAHSLALLSDAAHMLTDAASIGLALVTMRIAARPPRGGYTWGLQPHGDPVRAGQRDHSRPAGGVAWYVAVPAADRLALGGLATLVVALVGVAVNLAAAALISGPAADRARA